MSLTIEEYLTQLKKLMKDRDAATVRDALSDAEEHLRNAMAGEDPSRLDGIIEEYGSPEEIAAAYKIMEEHTPLGFVPARPRTDRNFLVRFFGVFVDPHAWGAVLYALISLVTGTLYFSWAVTGISLSVSMIIMIFGIPLAALIFLSFRGLALLEGRIVEALLGVRMPRRPVFTRKDVTWKQKLKTIFSSRVTWFSTLYLVLQFPISVTIFCVFITLLSFSLAFIAVPVLQYGFGIPVLSWNDTMFYFAPWSMPLFVIGGLLLLLVTMHFAKGMGVLRGKMARALLVAD